MIEKLTINVLPFITSYAEYKPTDPPSSYLNLPIAACNIRVFSAYIREHTICFDQTAIIVKRLCRQRRSNTKQI